MRSPPVSYFAGSAPPIGSHPSALAPSSSSCTSRSPSSSSVRIPSISSTQNCGQFFRTSLSMSHNLRLFTAASTGARAARTPRVPAARAASSASTPLRLPAFAEPANVPKQWLLELGHPLPPRVDLGVYKTPIQSWCLPGMEAADSSGTSLSIKRDDLTGTLLSGTNWWWTQAPRIPTSPREPIVSCMCTLKARARTHARTQRASVGEHAGFDFLHSI